MGSSPFLGFPTVGTGERALGLSTSRVWGSEGRRPPGKSTESPSRPSQRVCGLPNWPQNPALDRRTAPSSHSQPQDMVLPFPFPSYPKLRSNFTTTPMLRASLCPKHSSSLCLKHLALNNPQAESHCSWEANPPTSTLHKPPHPSLDLSSLGPTAISGTLSPFSAPVMLPGTPGEVAHARLGLHPHLPHPLCIILRRKEITQWGNLPIPALAQLTHWFSLSPARSCALALPPGGPRGGRLISPAYPGSL